MAFVEKRTRQRFPMNMELKFTVGGGRRNRIQGLGDVVDISSRGVAFRTVAALEPGAAIEASLAWPAVLNGDCALRVVIEGRVIRSAENLTVMSVERYEFRTSGRVGSVAKGEMELLKRSLASLEGTSVARATA